MSDLQDLWDEHVAAVFPDEARGVEVSGVDLVLLDADIAGCVDSYLKSDRRLDERRLAILMKCEDDVAAVVPSLHGRTRSYFERLGRMASMIQRKEP